MNYPLVEEYVPAVLSSGENLVTRKSLQPVLDSAGVPIMCIGDSSVVFKMVDVEDDRLYAMKCFLQEQCDRGSDYVKISEELEAVESPYILKPLYLEGELSVVTSQSDEKEFPVLLMDWVDGCTLGTYISNNYTDSFKTYQLVCGFFKLSSWLLSQNFTHGDIEPSNILVKENGDLVLVDYDGMYVPSMKGRNARGIGRPNFRHPKGILKKQSDDFAIVVLCLTLKVLSLDSDSFFRIRENGYCIFCESDYSDICGSEGLGYIVAQLGNPMVQKLFRIFSIVMSGRIWLSSNMLETIPVMVQMSEDCNYSSLTALTDADKDEIVHIRSMLEFSNSWTKKVVPTMLIDSSGRRLLKCCSQESDVTVPYGIEVICDSAFQSRRFERIVLPDSIRAIGAIAFANTDDLQYINIPANVTFIQHNNPFGGCFKLKDIRVDSPHFLVENDCFYSSDHRVLYASLFRGNDDKVEVHPNTKIVSGNAFWRRNIKEIVLPEGLSMVGNAAFAHCEELKYISIPNSVVEMGKKTCKNGMFEGCTKLEEVVLPQGITYIGDRFFWECGSLKSVDIPTGVREIGACAFARCSQLESIVIPSTVEVIHRSAFSLCYSVRSIYMPDSVVVLGGDGPDKNPPLFSFVGLFYRLRKLEDVRLPSKLDKIRERDFLGCRKLAKIDIPDAVTEIERSAFSGCDSLASVSLSKSLKSIQENAFWNCRSLESICLPDGLLTLARESFGQCSNLKHINLPSTLTHLEGNPFPGCYNLDIQLESDAFVLSGNSLYSFDRKFIYSYLGENDAVDAALEGVDGIAGYCFSRSKVKSVVFPSSVTSIGEHAFGFCEDLKTISLGSVREIGAFAFENCSSLEYIPIPASVERIGECAFGSCTKLKTISLGNVREIGAFAFKFCSSLEYVSIPVSVERIGEHVFGFCTGLKTISLGSAREIGAFAFENCYSLEYISVPTSVELIGEHAFDHCVELKTISLGSVCELGAFAFKDCKSLEYVSIPSSVKVLRTGLFEKCSSLRSVIIPDSVGRIEDRVFSGCESIEYIELSKSISKLPKNVFDGCTSLSVIKLNSFIPSLAEVAFDSSLSEIIVPDGHKEKYRAEMGRSSIFRKMHEVSEAYDDLPF